MDSKVSVIIPTYNSGYTLEKCLKCVRAQTYKNIEIIVVDNYSTDNTKEIAQKYAHNIYDKGLERSSQRNWGAKKSTGNYLVFVDSDMELTPKVIEECVGKMNQKNIAGIIIPEMSFGEGFWARCKALEKECYIGDETIEAARFFRKDVFFEHNGYDEEIAGGGEDWDLPQRMKDNGYNISRIDALIKHNEGKLTLVGTMKKKYYYAKTLDRYIKKHPMTAKKQLTLLRPAFIRNWKKLAKNPIYTTGMILMKTCEACAVFISFIEAI